MHKTLSDNQKDLILNKLAELSAEINPQTGVAKKASLSIVDKERIVNALLQDPTGRGLKRVAYAMTEPLRKRLDYMGIGRKLLEVDLLPQGVVPVYDADFAETPAVKVSARGNPPTVESWSDRVEVETFEIATNRSLKYAEISIRRFNALDRVKNKAAFELKIAEDDTIFSALNTAAVTNAQNTNVSSNVTRAALGAAWAQIEAKRLVVGNVLMHPTGFRGIRSTWNNADLDQVNMQALLETGWFASLWGARIYVTDRLDQFTSSQTPGSVAGTNTIYVMSLPMQLGKLPIRYDVEIKPFDFPPERAVLFSIYENLGVLVFNTQGICTVSITA